MDATRPESIARQAEETAERYLGAAPEPTEDRFTKSLERYTATVPSSGFLAVALGSMGLSLMLQLGGQGKWGNFVAQWVPTWLLFGIYNKLVKLEGHDRHDRGEGEGRSDATRRATGVSNRPLAEEWQSQSAVPPRGQAGGGRGA
jgi:hypothetical protein